MAVVAWQGFTQGQGGPNIPLPVPVAATTVNSTNPNNFPVLVTPSNSVSAATITNVKVNGTTVASVGGVQVGVPANGTIQCTFSTGTLTYTTAPLWGAVNASGYPFTDPVFQTFTVQQYLTVAGVTASGTFD